MLNLLFINRKQNLFSINGQTKKYGLIVFIYKALLIGLSQF
jgi:hypothetical protein